MNKVQILIVEDEVLVAKDIQQQLKTLGYEILDIVRSSNQAFASIASKQPDIILMDVMIDGDLDGIATAAKIKESHDIPIIYLTDLKDDHTFQRAKSTRPAVFLNKPFNEYELSRHIDLAIYNTYDSSNNNSEQSLLLEDFLWIKEDFSYKKIPIQDIHWIKASGSYCEIVCKSRKITLAKSMREVYDVLSDSKFTRIHKSFIINSDLIEEIKGGFAVLNGNEIPIGKTYLQDFKRKLKLL
ncbi:response regulator [Ekhidna sp.]|uniref:response regulator n=1 Tax=Ekhidna sp. TaxID=2608089 RepID=UPI0032EECB74